LGDATFALSPPWELDLLLDEFEVLESDIDLGFLHPRHHGDGPEEGKRQRG
jgi:hypothetical protein